MQRELAGQRQLQEDEFGPMVGGGPLLRMSSGGLAEVAIVGSSDGGASPSAGKGKAAAAPGGRPSIQLTVDSRGAAGQGAGAGAVQQAGPAPRQDSGDLEYAPNSRAVMARINRWWKNFDEGVMQPRFGGPSRAPTPHGSSANLAGAAGGAQVHLPHTSGQSFSVPISRPGG